MPQKDPLDRFMELPGVASAAQAAVNSIARAHRRPAGLRRPEVISSESLLRGARVSSPDMKAKTGKEVSAYSLLAPELLSTTIRSFSRAPLGVLAKIDVAAGGNGTPVVEQVPRVQALAKFLSGFSGNNFDRLAPVLVPAEIAAFRIFGEESELVAWVAARATAVYTGLDPRCFAVPETYLNRHRGAYLQGLEQYRAGSPRELLVLLFNAWDNGGREADSIAQAA